MIYKMELSDSVDTMVFDLLEVPIVDKDITGIAENTTIDGNVYEDYLWLKKQYVQKWSIMCQDEYDKLRGFWTRQFGNAEVPFYRLFYGSNIYEDRNFLTSDGFTQILNPTEKLAPLSLTHLYGNATQKTLSGKNLINFKTATYYTVWKASYTKNDDSLTVQATEGNIYASVAYRTCNCVQGTTYTFSMKATKPTTAGAVPNARLGKNTNVSADIISLCTSTLQPDGYYLIKHTFTAGSDFTLNISFYPNYGSTDIASSTFYDVQLELGAQASDYEEFCGGIPSPNPEFPQDIQVVTGEQTVNITGNNLINPSLLDARVFENDLTSLYYYDANLHFALKAGQTYTLSAKVDQITITPYRLSALIGTSTNATAELGTVPNLTTIGGRVSITFTVSQAQIDSAGGNNLFMRLPRYTTPTTTHYKISDIQLELGSQATTYEPYQAQSYEINLGGSNLLDVGNPLANTGVKEYNLALPAGTYTLSFKSATSTGAGVSSHMIIYDSNSTSLASTNVAFATPKWTFTIASASAKIAIYSQNTYNGSTGITTTFTDMMLNKGDTALPYAPYTTYQYELCKIGTYQDYIWNDDGTWYIRRAIHKVVLDGSTETTWSIRNTGTDRYYYRLQYLSDLHYLPDGSEWVSDRLSAGAIGETTTGEGCFIVQNGELRIRYGAEMSLADWKTWLASNNITLYYQAETPTDEEITDSELIEQLNHIYSLYQGQNNLWLIPNAGAQGEIEGTYRLIYDEETDIVPKTPVVLTLTDGGVINPCGCRQNIQLIMRETEGN